MRVRWMCSGFSPRLRFSLRRCLIQSWRSRTESQPTQSFMRWSGMAVTLPLLAPFDHHDFSAFHNLRAGDGGNLPDCSRKRRAQRVFHLHRFDYREALTAGDRVTDGDEKLPHPAVHRRLDEAVSPARLRGGDRNVLEAQPRLAPVTQDIDILSRRKRPCIRCRRGIAHHHMHAVLAERYRRRSRVGTDEDRDFNPASTGELKAVACVPRRIGFRRLAARWLAGKETRNTESRGGTVGTVRDGAER